VGAGFASWAFASVADTIDAVNRRDWGALDSILSFGVVYVSPLSRCFGRDAVRERHRELVAAVPDLRLFDLRLVGVEPYRHRAVLVHQQTGTLMHDLATPGGVVRATWEPFVADTEAAVTFDEEGFVLSVYTRSRVSNAA
jgi:hypothetical protein